MAKLLEIFGLVLFSVVVVHAVTTSTAKPPPVTSTTTKSPPPSSTLNPNSKKAAEMRSDDRLKAPWTAAIFLKISEAPSEQWKFICSGTITSPYTIITSARCVRPQIFGPRLSLRPHHFRYSDLQVVVGLPSTDLSSKDQFTQFGTVGQIRDVYEFQSSGDTPDNDLAGIRLKNVFNLSTPYVKSVALFETSGTLQEAKETLTGQSFIVSGYENPDKPGVTTRSQDNAPLTAHTITISNTETCIDRYTSSYPTYYFNVLCAVSPVGMTIPCRFQGAGLVKKITDANGSQETYLFGVYSSNSALAQSEGTLVDKNKRVPPPCSPTDVIFITRYSQLGRWALSNQFCDNELAMCKNDRCRPWEDLCSASAECDDASDEDEKMCFHQNRECGKDQFRCGYGACIKGSLTCDGIQDCKDGSDEDPDLTCKAKRLAKSGNSTMVTPEGPQCDGFKSQESVNAFCSHEERSGLLPCDSAKLPVGTKAVLRPKEVVVTCGRDGKWSRSTRLTC